MPDLPTYPGVYIEETPSGARSISRVSTSVALFIGRTVQGPMGTPVKCLSYSDFVNVFSGDTTLGELSDQVRLFFNNGGQKCYVIRISGSELADDSLDSGSAPLLSDYQKAFLVADREIDLFNLMVLPRVLAPAQPMSDLYGPASIFCQSKRALLLMEAPSGWADAQTASNEVDDLRVGLVNEHAALFYPDVTVNDNGYKNIGPAGAIAGLMARIDSLRGVWKAPAGMEASLRGVVGLQQDFTDSENGMMNVRAINTLRVFPNGIVNWGARTMDGDDRFNSEYKYIPVRRLTSHIEESLYRGLQWAVFEPNDEPLWAMIRLNSGVFLQALYRQGAFSGSNPGDAYFVKCDGETTTPADRNLGLVNILVGFAPLKPAEFVVISLQLVVEKA